MPSLEEILRKTKAKSEHVKFAHRPPSIATTDRPYSNSDSTQVLSPSSPTVNLEELKKPDIKNDKKLHKDSIQIETKLETNETDNKVATNREQSGNKVAAEVATKWQQTDNEVATKSQQSVNNSVIKNQNWQQSGNTTGNKTDNKVVTKWQQTENKVTTTMPFSKLVGLQREIVIFMCHECKNSRSRTTEALTLEYMENSLKHSAGAIKTTIQRLEKKGCLIRVEFKNGRGGWSRYELPDSIYHDVIRSESGNKLTTNREQTGNKAASQLATEPATSLSSSSSFLNIKETTTTALSEEWNFDITPYHKFGFTNTQLKQLASLGTISAANVEQSLLEFSYDLDNNTLPPIKTTKINFLMGLLRAGHTYVSEGFKNEQEAMIIEMANRAEGKRKNLLEAKFGAWEAGLSDEERKEIEKKLPTYLMVPHRTHGVSNSDVRNWLFNYYLQLSSQ